MLQKLREARAKRTTAGEIGIMMLHIVFAMYAFYSAYHGINATASYRAVSGPWAIAGIIGIISVEFMLAGLYLAAMKSKIVGTAMQVTAAIFGALGFGITILSIIGDSQMNAGLTPPPWLHFYLTTVLPAAPFVAALGSFLVLWFSPWLTRRRAEAKAEDDDAEDEHSMKMEINRAERDAEYASKQVELDTKLALAEQLNRYAKSEEVQRHIEATVAAKGPGILRAAGLIIDSAPPRITADDVSHLLARPADNVGNSTHATPPANAAHAGQGDAGNGAPGPVFGADTRRPS